MRTTTPGRGAEEQPAGIGGERHVVRETPGPAVRPARRRRAEPRRRAAADVEQAPIGGGEHAERLAQVVGPEALRDVRPREHALAGVEFARESPARPRTRAARDAPGGESIVASPSTPSTTSSSVPPESPMSTLLHAGPSARERCRVRAATSASGGASIASPGA